MTPRQPLLPLGPIRHGVPSMTDDNGFTRIEAKGVGPSEPEDAGNSSGSTEPLTELVSTFERYIILPRGASVAIGLWVLHTHMYREFYYTPRLIIRSPVKRCGKTNVLMLIEKLAMNAKMSANI